MVILGRGHVGHSSPEILQAMEDGLGKDAQSATGGRWASPCKKGFTGKRPSTQSPVETYGKIMNHKDRLQFPPHCRYV